MSVFIEIYAYCLMGNHYARPQQGIRQANMSKKYALYIR